MSVCDVREPRASPSYDDISILARFLTYVWFLFLSSFFLRVVALFVGFFRLGDAFPALTLLPFVPAFALAFARLPDMPLMVNLPFFGL